MAWFLRGVQSAVFHYASCAPCTGYADGRKRRRDAKQARKAREKLMLEEPDTYHHPEPTGTNPFWGEEIAKGPGPPPRRARRTGTGTGTTGTGTGTGTGSTWGITTAGTLSSVASKVGSSLDGESKDVHDLQDLQDPLRLSDESLDAAMPRPTASRTGSYHCARAPPVNDLHPPVVSLPSPDPVDNLWMLQPPPRASVMAGRERATHVSRCHSGASSRVELRLAHRSRTPQARPPSSTSSRRKRRDTAISTKSTLTCTNTHTSTGDVSDVSPYATATLPPSTTTHTSDIHCAGLRTRDSRPILSTIVSSDSNIAPSSPHSLHRPATSHENALPEKPSPIHHHQRDHRHFSSTDVHLNNSDLSSLNCLQDLVSPHALLRSSFVSAPLVEAKIRLPPSNEDMGSRIQQQGTWKSRAWQHVSSDDDDDDIVRVPFDSLGAGRDPRLRWSVDF